MFINIQKTRLFQHVVGGGWCLDFESQMIDSNGHKKEKKV